LLFEAGEPDHVENADGFLETKLAALLAHRSQLFSTFWIDDPGDPEQIEGLRKRVAAHLAEHGAIAGLADGEAFRILDLL
jgi:hypothetical protein